MIPKPDGYVLAFLNALIDLGADEELATETVAAIQDQNLENRSAAYEVFSRASAKCGIPVRKLERLRTYNVLGH
jgi:hypothetical protein